MKTKLLKKKKKKKFKPEVLAHTTVDGLTFRCVQIAEDKGVIEVKDKAADGADQWMPIYLSEHGHRLDKIRIGFLRDALGQNRPPLRILCDTPRHNLWVLVAAGCVGFALASVLRVLLVVI